MPTEAPDHSGSESDRPVVLVFGLRPEWLLDSEGRIDAFLEPPGQEHFGVLVEAVRDDRDLGGSWVREPGAGWAHRNCG